MTPDQLLEVLGGKDLLVMMCDAKRFSAGKDSVKFWVGPYIVELSFVYPTARSDNGVSVGRYWLVVKHRKTKMNTGVERYSGDGILRGFEDLTGYSLSF